MIVLLFEFDSRQERKARKGTRLGASRREERGKRKKEEGRETTDFTDEGAYCGTPLGFGHLGDR